MTQKIKAFFRVMDVQSPSFYPIFKWVWIFIGGNNMSIGKYMNNMMYYLKLIDCIKDLNKNYDLFPNVILNFIINYL